MYHKKPRKTSSTSKKHRCMGTSGPDDPLPLYKFPIGRSLSLDSFCPGDLQVGFDAVVEAARLGSAHLFRRYARNIASCSQPGGHSPLVIRNTRGGRQTAASTHAWGRLRGRRKRIRGGGGCGRWFCLARAGHVCGRENITYVWFSGAPHLKKTHLRHL
jgi:hypothetical protein